MNESRDRAAILAPPGLLVLICVAAGAVMEHFKPLPLLPGLGHSRIAICIVLVLVAVTIVASAIRQFVRHKEHPSPYRPTTAIVESGIYCHTRNPIYLGFLIIVLAVAVAMNSAWLVVSDVALLLLLNVAIVKPEERYLSGKFGTTYHDYRTRVRRWI